MSIWYLTAIIGLFNLMTFGNGPVMIPLLQTSLVDGAGVLTQDELLYAFTVARVTPGQANTYVASVGYMLHGFPGAVLATLVLLLPGYLMLPALKAYGRFRDSPRIGGFTRGLAATSVGLILAAVVQIGGSTLDEPVAWIVIGAMLAMTQLLKWNVFVALAVACGLGVLLKVWL
jgi:chromate transporter